MAHSRPPALRIGTAHLTGLVVAGTAAACVATTVVILLSLGMFATDVAFTAPRFGVLFVVGAHTYILTFRCVRHLWRRAATRSSRRCPLVPADRLDLGRTTLALALAAVTLGALLQVATGGAPVVPSDAPNSSMVRAGVELAVLLAAVGHMTMSALARWPFLRYAG